MIALNGRRMRDKQAPKTTGIRPDRACPTLQSLGVRLFLPISPRCDRTDLFLGYCNRFVLATTGRMSTWSGYARDLSSAVSWVGPRDKPAIYR